jgi:hypothetical protein
VRTGAPGPAGRALCRRRRALGSDGSSASLKNLRRFSHSSESSGWRGACHHLPQHVAVQLLLGRQALEPGVLLLQVFRPGQVIGAHSRVLGSPAAAGRSGFRPRVGDRRRAQPCSRRGAGRPAGAYGLPGPACDDCASRSTTSHPKAGASDLIGGGLISGVGSPCTGPASVDASATVHDFKQLPFSLENHMPALAESRRGSSLAGRPSTTSVRVPIHLDGLCLRSRTGSVQSPAT